MGQTRNLITNLGLTWIKAVGPTQILWDKLTHWICKILDFLTLPLFHFFMFQWSKRFFIIRNIYVQKILFLKNFHKVDSLWFVLVEIYVRFNVFPYHQSKFSAWELVSANFYACFGVLPSWMGLFRLNGCIDTIQSLFSHPHVHQSWVCLKK